MCRLQKIGETNGEQKIDNLTRVAGQNFQLRAAAARGEQILMRFSY